MSHIDIRHPNTLGKAGARRAIEQIAAKLADEFGVSSRWMDDALDFERSGIHGRIALDGEDIHVSARLGLLLSAMKAPIEAEIRRVLADKLGPAA